MGIFSPFSGSNFFNFFVIKKSINMKDAETHLESAYKSMKFKRESFIGMKTKSVELNKMWGVEPNVQQRKLTCVKKHCDELNQMKELWMVKKVSRRNLQSVGRHFCYLILRMFQVFSAIIDGFSVLSPTLLENASNNQFYDLSKCLTY